MEEMNRFTISTQDLISELVSLGYKKKAKEIGKENLEHQELKKALSTSSKEINLPIDLINILRSIVNTKQKIICKLDAKQLIFYPYEKGNFLVEIIENKKHTFSVKALASDLKEILGEYYGIDIKKNNQSIPNSVKIDFNFYDLIHTVPEGELEQFIDEKLDEIIKDGKAELTKEFLRDFKDNEQKMSQITFMNENLTDFTEFLLPGKDYIWFVENENVKNKEITIASIGIRSYLQKLERLIIDFFTEFHTLKENRVKSKFFSFKRGILFFVKSNMLLTFFVVLLFVNKNSWVYDSDASLIFNIVQSEILILFLSLFACFQREKAKLKILNR